MQVADFGLSRPTSTALAALPRSSYGTGTRSPPRPPPPLRRALAWQPLRISRVRHACPEDGTHCPARKTAPLPRFPSPRSRLHGA